METVWPRYELYAVDEVRRVVARSRFIFCPLAVLMVGAFALAMLKGAPIPVIVAYGLGALLNLFAWAFVSRRYSRKAAGLVAISNVLVAALHLFFLQADVALWIALAVYSVNMRRASSVLRKTES